LALNADLCFIPLKHSAQERLPAVSGSSGRLLVQSSQTEHEGGHWWPGLVFADAELEYEEAMRCYVAATADRLVHAKAERSPEIQAPNEWRIATQQQVERHQVLQQRKQEDKAWKAAKAEYRQARQAYQALSRAERQQQWASWQETRVAWCTLREQRRSAVLARQSENQAWHVRNQQRMSDVPLQIEDRLWLAVLVVTDNCTRQSLGLPVFSAGAKLTGQELVDALRTILPDELQFFISDQGAHFRTKAFAHLATERNFVHVPVYRHRPESNGIAERFVLTLKDWLKDCSWQFAGELALLLSEFVSEYNDRPHQGLAIPGLSPNEFAKRIWLM
jgi:transposase InsO family protein